MKILSVLFICLIAAASFASSGTEKRWEFDVYLDDKRVGSHEYELVEDGGVQRVESNAEFKVRILLITAYRYSHSNTEIWSGECLQRFDASTRVNGEEIDVFGKQTENGFVVDTGESEAQLPECVMSFAYWNPSFLEEKSLVNPQTGEYVDVTVEELPAETVEVRGESLLANRFRVTADTEKEKLELTLWYSDDDEWLALESVARGGRIIRYELS